MAVEPRDLREEQLREAELAELAPVLHAFLQRHFDRFDRDPDIRQQIVHDSVMDLWEARRTKPELERGSGRAMVYVKEAVRSHAVSRIRAAARNPARAAEPRDPTDVLLRELADEAADPAGRVEAALSNEQVTEFVSHALDENERVLFYARDVLGWSRRDICRKLGWSLKRFNKRAEEAHLKLARDLAERQPELWSEKSHDLIAAIYAGTATHLQKRRFAAWKRRDERFRAEVSRYEATHQAILAALPMETAARLDGGGGVVERVSAAVDRARELISGGGDAASSTATHVAAGGGARGSGATAAAAVGLAGVGGAGKAAVAVCVGASAACIAAVVPAPGVPGLGGDSKDDEPKAERVKSLEDVARVDRGPQPPDSLPTTPTEGSNGGDQEDEGEGSSGDPAADTSATSASAPAPTPAQREFDPLASGAPTAAPPSAPNGGSSGGSSSGGGAASQEFARP